MLNLPKKCLLCKDKKLQKTGAKIQCTKVCVCNAIFSHVLTC